MGEKTIRFLKAKSALINKEELDNIERLGLYDSESLQPSQVHVTAYYPIDQCNIHAVTEFVDNEGFIIKGKCNVIFIGESTIAAHVGPEEFINLIEGEVVKL